MTFSIAGRCAGTSPTVVPVMGFSGIEVKVEGGFSNVLNQRIEKQMADGKLEVDFAFLTECADHPPTRVRSIACWSADEGNKPSFEYELAGTPCDEVINGKRTCFYPERLAQIADGEAHEVGEDGMQVRRGEEVAVGADGRFVEEAARSDEASRHGAWPKAHECCWKPTSFPTPTARRAWCS